MQLDEIFRTFDAQTRAAFQTWMQQLAIADTGRGADLSAAIANLEPFAQDANRVLRVLDTQQGAVQQLVRNTGVVFGALSERQGQLQGLIRNGDTVFATTARRNRDLEAAFRALPTFLDESRLTLSRLDDIFARRKPADHAATSLGAPAERRISSRWPRSRPDFRGFFTGFRKVEQRADAALPALRALLGNDLPPLLNNLQPFLAQLTPIVAGALRYDQDITAFLGNATAAFQGANSTAESNNQPAHYLRSAGLLSPEAFAVFPTHRLTTNRSNPYLAPGGALDVASALKSFPIDACPGASRVVANLISSGPLGPTGPTFTTRFPPPIDPNDLFNRIKHFGFSDGHQLCRRRCTAMHQPGPAGLDRPDPGDDRLPARLLEPVRVLTGQDLPSSWCSGFRERNRTTTRVIAC